MNGVSSEVRTMNPMTETSPSGQVTGPELSPSLRDTIFLGSGTSATERDLFLREYIVDMFEPVNIFIYIIVKEYVAE